MSRTQHVGAKDRTTNFASTATARCPVHSRRSRSERPSPTPTPSSRACGVGWVGSGQKLVEHVASVHALHTIHQGDEGLGQTRSVSPFARQRVGWRCRAVCRGQLGGVRVQLACASGVVCSASRRRAPVDVDLRWALARVHAFGAAVVLIEQLPEDRVTAAHASCGPGPRKVREQQFSERAP